MLTLMLQEYGLLKRALEKNGMAPYKGKPFFQHSPMILSHNSIIWQKLWLYPIATYTLKVVTGTSCASFPYPSLFGVAWTLQVASAAAHPACQSPMAAWTLQAVSGTVLLASRVPNGGLDPTDDIRCCLPHLPSYQSQPGLHGGVRDCPRLPPIPDSHMDPVGCVRHSLPHLHMQIYLPSLMS